MEFNQLIKQLKAKEYKPIYFLFGEEEYFIDKAFDYFESKVLNEEEKEFNCTVLYGLETDAITIAGEAKRFPMMSPYNLVLVKEAQNLKNWDGLKAYFEQPSPTTILVFCYKYGKPDGRKDAFKAMKKTAVQFESKRLYENQVSPWLDQYIKSKGFTIEAKANQVMLESIGFELTKLSNEVDKMLINAAKNQKIDLQFIEENIGISKEYNVFELNAALGKKDVLKANRIIKHFGKNPKVYPLPKILPSLYRFFSQLLLFHAVKKGSNQSIAAELGISPFFLNEYKSSAANYPVKKLARVMTYLREADLKSKGIGASTGDTHEVLMELIFKILH